MASPRPLWHLSFDCATKTFAFSLSRIDLDAYAAASAQLRRRLEAAREVASRAAALDQPADAARLVAALEVEVPKLAAEVRSYLRLVDGATSDLFPGRPDADISTVERLRAVARYVAQRIRPALRVVPADERLRVVIEYQMGANARARAVAAALVALFAEDDVIIVGPSLKNKVAVCAEGRYCHFAQRYRTTYGANKAHAKFNFARLEALFGTSIPETTPALRGHIADSLMQVMGYLAYGADEKNAALMF
jgi:hypothetical protein